MHSSKGKNEYSSYLQYKIWFYCFYYSFIFPLVQLGKHWTRDKSFTLFSLLSFVLLSNNSPGHSFTNMIVYGNIQYVIHNCVIHSNNELTIIQQSKCVRCALKFNYFISKILPFLLRVVAFSLCMYDLYFCIVFVYSFQFQHGKFITILIKISWFTNCPANEWWQLLLYHHFHHFP